MFHIVNILWWKLINNEDASILHEKINHIGQLRIESVLLLYLKKIRFYLTGTIVHYFRVMERTEIDMILIPRRLGGLDDDL